MVGQPVAESDLAGWLLTTYPGEAAGLIEQAPDEETAALLDGCPRDVAIAVLRRVTPDRAARIVALLSTRQRREVLSALNYNLSAAILARLSEAERERCLEDLPTALSVELRDLMQYPPDTAGALMDPRATTFRADATTHDVVRRLKRFRDRRIPEVFVVEEEGRLLGSVSLEAVVLADDGTALAELADTRAVAVPAIASREEIVQTFESLRLAMLPVVDADGRVVGVLRAREIVEAVRETATADAVTMVGASEQERALSPPLFAVRKRLPWLQINLVTAFLAAAVVGLFEETIASVTALAVLLPVVAGQSGNTGAQALAVTMRGLSLREVRTRHWLQVAVKETLAGAGNGVAVAVTTAFAVYLWSRSVGLAVVICVSMVISMTLAGLSGALIPMLLTALRQDPAQSSSIILTTVTDVVGFFSFLGIATLMMSQL